MYICLPTTDILMVTHMPNTNYYYPVCIMLMSDVWPKLEYTINFIICFSYSPINVLLKVQFQYLVFHNFYMFMCNDVMVHLINEI